MVKKLILRFLTDTQKLFAKKLLSWILFYLNRNKKKVSDTDNIVNLDGYVRLKKSTIAIKGNSNKIIIGDHTRIENLLIRVTGNNCTVTIGKECHLMGGRILVQDNNCEVSIGSGTYSGGNLSLVAIEDNSKITIGSDCLLSSSILVQTTDYHSIVDLVTGKRINSAENISIGNMVWIGRHAVVLKGVSAENNSIIGIGSIVTKNVPSHCAVAGNPAKVIKTNVDWRHER